MRLGSSSFRSVIFLLFRGFLGAVFIYASIGKIIHPESFAEAISNYQILPDQLINLVALILPWLELVVGTCLIAGFWLPSSLFLVNLLLLVFWSALLSAFARGLNIECGCFDTSAGKLVTGSMAWYLVRDTILLLIGVMLFWETIRREKSMKLD